MCITITTLIENNRVNNRFQYEHGLSFHIKTDNTTILFDTGQSEKFVVNADQLGVDLEEINHVVLSHGHYDHGGGFTAFVNRINHKTNLYISDNFLNKKYTYVNGEYLYKGVDFDCSYLKDKDITTNFLQDKIKYIAKDVFLAAKFPLKDGCENVSEHMLIQKNGKYYQDEFIDEIVLGINTYEGLIVIVGCSHPGIMNILSTLMERTGEKIYMVIGGTHLVHASDSRINKTINFLKANKIKYIGLSHCTGDKAVAMIKNRMEGYFQNNAGTVVQVGRYGDVNVL